MKTKEASAEAATTEIAEAKSNEFVPENYTIPSKSDQFLKFKQGKTKFRILSPSVRGWCVFAKKEEGDGVTPVRRRETEGEFSVDELEALQVRKNNQGKLEKPRHFWLFLVYDYESQKFKVLELTQKKLKKAILEYIQNEDYGQPYEYDLTVTKSGEGLKTEYSVVASPPKALAPEIKDTFEQLEYNLDAIFDNEYPMEKY